MLEKRETAGRFAGGLFMRGGSVRHREPPSRPAKPSISRPSHVILSKAERSEEFAVAA
jgi:hypothetical protein